MSLVFAALSYQGLYQGHDQGLCVLCNTSNDIIPKFVLFGFNLLEVTATWINLKEHAI